MKLVNCLADEYKMLSAIRHICVFLLLLILLHSEAYVTLFDVIDCYYYLGHGYRLLLDILTGTYHFPLFCYLFLYL